MVTETIFEFIAGDACLDFVNTVGARVGRNRKRDLQDVIVGDKLAGFDDLVRWSVEAGLLSRVQATELSRQAARNARAAQAVFERALALREALYRVCKSHLEGWTPPPADLAVVDTAAADARAHQHLEYAAGQFVYCWTEPCGMERIVWTLANSATAFLASPKIAWLRQCPGDECGWLFLDASRNRSRRWCEMRVCGNRAKVRRFRQSAEMEDR